MIKAITNDRTNMDNCTVLVAQQTTSLPSYIKKACQENKNSLAVEDRYTNTKMTFGEFYEQVVAFGAALQAFNVQKGEKISLFSENNGRWMVADQAILTCGAVDAVRGSNAPVGELEYILDHSDSVGVVLRDGAIFEKLKNKLNSLNLRFVVILFADGLDAAGVSCPVFAYENFIELGRNSEFKEVEISPEDDATLIYTSGTTSNPKGVLLSHDNLMSQIELIHPILQAKAGETILCVLPVWHAYERSVEYYFFSQGVALKHTNIKNIKSDLTRYNTTYMVAVPRIWESLANNILNGIRNRSKIVRKVIDFSLALSRLNRKSLRYLDKVDVKIKNYNPLMALYKSVLYFATLPLYKFFKKTFYNKMIKHAGIGFKVCISGGGALAPVFAEFFEAIGVKLVVGYGLTETAPIITLNSVKHLNILYSAGKPLPNTEIKVVDPETKVPLKNYEKGLVLARGRQIMKGYYKNPMATREVMHTDGWFITGDIGWMTDRNDLVLTGRQKEIIVLSNGENVEPTPIEAACLESSYIEQIVVVGQDRAVLGALIVPSVNAYKEIANIENPTVAQKEKIHATSDFREFFKKEIMLKTKAHSHFRSFEKISKFDFVSEEFSLANGLLTQTAKIRRNIIADKYEKKIEQMYK